MMAGTAITQIKALLYSGEQMYAWDDPELWTRSVLNGGTFGILGDFLANNTDLMHGDFLKIGSPLTDALGKVAKLTIVDPIKEYQGKEVHAEADAIKALGTVTPNFWYTRLLWERAIGDELLKQSDPSAYAKKLKYIRQHKEGTWWAPGGHPEAVRPETVIGQ
jgi:hypothetical protein